MSSPINDHKFNDDLLIGHEDRQSASQKYPTILHVLDSPELRELFLKYDKPANRAKRIGRLFGLGAIGFVYIALVMASSESFLPHGHAVTFADQLREPASIVALASALFGINGVLIGSVGILHAKRKRQWLYQRLMTERVRQFHFQAFVFRLGEILASLEDDAAKEAYRQKRRAWLNLFQTRFHGKLDTEFLKLGVDEIDPGIWLHDSAMEARHLHDTKELDPLFAAYRELRIIHQIDYANYKLADDHKIFSDRPRTQSTTLSTIGWLCIAVLCAIHVAIVGVVFLAPAALSTFSLWSGRIAIFVALTALAVRAVEEGLQPEREIERYQHYRSALRAVLNRFDLAPSQNRKLEVMKEMERLSFDEMRDFLLTNERSRFVM